MKALVGILLTLLLLLQYRLWVGEGSFADVVRLNADIAKQAAENARLMERNRLLNAEVAALRNGDDAIIERARNDLGMIKKGETFFMVVQNSSEKH